MLRCDMLEQCRVTEAFAPAIGTCETLKLSRRGRRACTIGDLEHRTCQDALHGMIGRVSCRCCIALVALGAEIIVEADETFVAATAKVVLHTEITRDSLNGQDGMSWN